MLKQLGNFSDAEMHLLDNYLYTRHLDKNEILDESGSISTSLFYIVKGSFYQYYRNEYVEEEIITDLHVEGEWAINLQSLVMQQPAKATLKAFEKSEVRELKLQDLHELIAVSQRFLQFNKLLNAPNLKMDFYNENMSPAEKYNHLLQTKPQLIQTFPLSMIASYLKIRPETLSRVRANIAF